jgi:hypothetical protein
MLLVNNSKQQSMRPCYASRVVAEPLSTTYKPEVSYFFPLRELPVTRLPFLNTGSCLMAKKLSTRRAWTKEQVRTLKTLARKRTGAARIAKTLKRTEGATRQKAFSIGLSLDSRV